MFEKARLAPGAPNTVFNARVDLDVPERATRAKVHTQCAGLSCAHAQKYGIPGADEPYQCALGETARIGSNRKLVRAERVHGIHPRHCGYGMSVPKYVDLDATHVRDRCKDRIEGSWILPALIYREMNCPLRCIDRNDSNLRERKGVVVGREILEDKVGTATHHNAVLKRLSEVESGALQVNR